MAAPAWKCTDGSVLCCFPRSLLAPVLFPTPRLLPVLWLLVLWFSLHTGRFVRLRYLHFSLQPLVYSWCLSRSLKNAIWSTPMKHWPSVSFLSVIFCPVCIRMRAGTGRVNRGGISAGVASRKRAAGHSCALCRGITSKWRPSLCKDQRSVEL